MSEHTFNCPCCGKEISCDSSYIGYKAECPFCQQKFLVPDVSLMGSKVVEQEIEDVAEEECRKPARKKRVKNSTVLFCTIGFLGAMVVGLLIVVASLVLNRDTKLSAKTTHVTEGKVVADRNSTPVKENPIAEVVAERNPVKDPLPKQIVKDRPMTSSAALRMCVTISCISGVGSGFFVMQGGELKVVTCRHVVEDEPVVVVKDINGNQYETKRISVSKDRDVAVIELFSPFYNTSYFKIAGDVSSVSLNTELACYGDSEGTGVIVPCYGKLLGIGPTSVETDTPFVPGNSGGPVVTTNSHEVIGVASILTRLSEGSKWVKGTRFEKQTRHFAVRIDNIAWNHLTETTYGLIADSDYDKLVQEAAIAMKDGKVDKAIAIYTYCAEKDHSIALNELGKIIFVVNRAKGESDYKDALELFQKASEKGSNDAKTYLGLCYKFGIGVRKDVDRAFKLFCEASESNDYAKYQCGVCYRDGIGTAQDLKNAVKWFNACVEKSEPHGMNDLGDMYWDGIGVEKDRRKAFNLFKMAASFDYSEAQCNMGVCYQNGAGVNENRAEAAKWFEKAAEQGLSRAQDYLGDCYLLGDGVKEDGSTPKLVENRLP